MWPEKRLWVNFPSSVHLRAYDEVRAEAEAILAAEGGSERLRRDLHLATNAPVLEAFLRSPLAGNFPALA